MKIFHGFLVFIGLLMVINSCSKKDPQPTGSVSVSAGVVSDITVSAAKVQVALSSTGTITLEAKGVCWGTTENPTTSNAKTNDGTSLSSFTSQLTGLTAATNYFVRAYVTSSGKTTYGSQVTFKTLASFQVTLTTTPITSVLSTSASSGGSMTLSGTGTVTAKGVCWSLSSSPTISGSKTSDGSGTSSFTSTLTGLTANTKYFVRAFVSDDSGNTFYGNELSFTSDQASTSSVTLTTNPITSITFSSAISGGVITVTGNTSITAKGICWSLNTAPAISSNKTNEGSGSASFSSNMTGLAVNTKYFVRAYATDNSSNTYYGSELSFTTSAAPQFTVTVTTNAVTSINESSGITGGSITTSGTGSISSKGVCWSVTSSPTTANSKTSDGSGTTSFTSSISGLASGTKYYVRAYATDNSGVTSYGGEVSFTTATNDFWVNPNPVTTPTTNFIDFTQTLNNLGSWYMQGFTVSGPTQFVSRFTSQYKADCAIITADQVDNFKNNRSFTGYAIFDDQFGTNYITLNAGSYYYAMRNQITSANVLRAELDLAVSLPASNKTTYYDNYFQHSEIVGKNGGKLWQPFTIQSRFRYFLDGCNSGLKGYIIKASEIDKFKNGQTFSYYTDYSSDQVDNAQPGFNEINLPLGDYFLVFVNPGTVDNTVTYTMDRWAVQ